MEEEWGRVPGGAHGWETWCRTSCSDSISSLSPLPPFISRSARPVPTTSSPSSRSRAVNSAAASAWARWSVTPCWPTGLPTSCMTGVCRVCMIGVCRAGCIGASVLGGVTCALTHCLLQPPWNICLPPAIDPPNPDSLPLTYRLHACSDYHVMDVCSKCGSLIAPLNMPHAAASVTQVGGG